MASLNKVQLIGRLGKDPEIRFSPAKPDEPIASFSIATGGEKFKDKITGAERQTETEWHNCTAFGATAKVVQNYIKKGNQIYVEGKIKSEKYNDINGVEKTSIKIIVNQLVMLGSKADNLQQANSPSNAIQGERFSYYTAPMQPQVAPAPQVPPINPAQFNTWGQPVQPMQPMQPTNFTPDTDVPF